MCITAIYLQVLQFYLRDYNVCIDSDIEKLFFPKTAGAVVTLCTECASGIVVRFVSMTLRPYDVQTKRELKYQYPQ